MLNPLPVPREVVPVVPRSGRGRLVQAAALAFVFGYPAVASALQCPSYVPIMCPDGSCIAEGYCPCPAGYPYDCGDDTCSTEPSCGRSTCPAGYPYDCGDGTCSRSHRAVAARARRVIRMTAETGRARRSRRAGATVARRIFPTIAATDIAATARIPTVAPMAAVRRTALVVMASIWTPNTAPGRPRTTRPTPRRRLPRLPRLRARVRAPIHPTRGPQAPVKATRPARRTTPKKKSPASAAA